MKTYRPFKYKLLLIGLTIFEVTVAYFCIFYPMTELFIWLGTMSVGEQKIDLVMLAGACIIIGLYAFVCGVLSTSLVINETSITNEISDGTRNYGWIEHFENIKKIELVKRKEVQKYYKNCRAKKAILITLEEYNVKYIAVDLFTKRQINEIISVLDAAILRQK